VALVEHDNKTTTSMRMWYDLPSLVAGRSRCFEVRTFGDEDHYHSSLMKCIFSIDDDCESVLLDGIIKEASSHCFCSSHNPPPRLCLLKPIEQMLYGVAGISGAFELKDPYIQLMWCNFCGGLAFSGPKYTEDEEL
jgi:hypothetical protein